MLFCATALLQQLDNFQVKPRVTNATTEGEALRSTPASYSAIGDVLFEVGGRGSASCQTMHQHFNLHYGIIHSVCVQVG